MYRGNSPLCESLKFEVMKTTLLNYAKITRIFLMTVLLTILISGHANSSHLVGGEITYQWVSGNTYNVKLILYRDCSGITPGSVIDLFYTSSCFPQGTFTVNQVGLPEQVSPICSAQLVNSSCNGGIIYGVERYSYEGILTLPGVCNDWLIYFDSCCRNAAINNLDNAASYGSFISSMLNNADVPFNNSVQFGSIPVNIINNNVTTSLSWNTFDIDGDSLIYELIPARESAGVFPLSTINLTYSPGYSFQQPFLSSSPTNLDYGTGILEVSPNASQVSVVCMKVSEYRNGFLIGEVCRDFQISVISSSNSSPTLTGIDGTTSFITNGCPGDSITFDVFSNDVDPGQNVTLVADPFNPNGSWNMSGGQFPTGTFLWVPSTADISSQPYTFTVNVNDDNCDYYGTQTYVYRIYVNGCNTNEVWPGDANSDGTANLYDLLAIGLSYNDNGPVRPSANLTWVAQPCTNWTNAFVSGINHKHADTDGNGTVNSDDTTAIMLNYGLNHALRNAPVNSQNVVDLNVTANYDTVGTQMAVNFDIALASPVDSIYGLAFRMYFDPSLVDMATTQITYPGSIFGTNGVNMVKVDKIFGATGFIDIALSRIDQQNIGGSGQVARITIVTTDNVSGKVTLNVEPFSVEAITANEFPVLVNTSGDHVVIDPGFSGINENILEQQIIVYPVPAKDILHFNFGGNETVHSIKFYDLNGREVMNVQKPSNKLTIGMQSIAKGVYYMKVTIGENSIVKKIVKI